MWAWVQVSQRVPGRPTRHRDGDRLRPESSSISVTRCHRVRSDPKFTDTSQMTEEHPPVASCSMRVPLVSQKVSSCEHWTERSWENCD